MQRLKGSSSPGKTYHPSPVRRLLSPEELLHRALKGVRRVDNEKLRTIEANSSFRSKLMNSIKQNRSKDMPSPTLDATTSVGTATYRSRALSPSIKSPLADLLKLDLRLPSSRPDRSRQEQRSPSRSFATATQTMGSPSPRDQPVYAFSNTAVIPIQTSPDPTAVRPVTADQASARPRMKKRIVKKIEGAISQEKKVDENWREFLDRAGRMDSRHREVSLVQRVKKDAAVIAGLCEELQDAYQLLTKLHSASQQGEVELGDLELRVKEKCQQLEGGHLAGLVRRVAKIKLAEAREHRKATAEAASLKLERLALETQNAQNEIEHKRLHRAFQILSERHDALTDSMLKKQGNQSPKSADNSGSSKLAEVIVHVKASLERVRDGTDDAANTLEQSFATMLGCGESALLVRSPDGKIYSAKGKRKAELESTHRALARVLSGAERVFVSNDPLADPAFTRSVGQALGFRVANLMSLPVRRKSRQVEAFLIFTNKRGRSGAPIPFSRVDEPLAELAGALASTWLQVRELNGLLSHSRAAYKDGLVLADALYHDYSFGRFIRNVEMGASKFFEVQRATFLICDEKRRELFRRIARAGAHDTLQSYPCDRGIAGSVAASCAPTAVSGVPHDARFEPAIDDPHGGTQAQELLAVPVLLGAAPTAGLPAGVLILINRLDGAPFSQDDAEAVSNFAPLIARALDIVSKFERFLSLDELFADLNNHTAELDQRLHSNAGYYTSLQQNYRALGEMLQVLQTPDRNPLLSSP